jgi:TnpA family transposase
MWQMTGLYKKGQFKSHVYINQQLDKAEATNVLARDIFFDKNGEFR